LRDVIQCRHHDNGPFRWHSLRFQLDQNRRAQIDVVDGTVASFFNVLINKRIASYFNDVDGIQHQVVEWQQVNDPKALAQVLEIKTSAITDAQTTLAVGVAAGQHALEPNETAEPPVASASSVELQTLLSVSVSTPSGAVSLAVDSNSSSGDAVKT